MGLRAGVHIRHSVWSYIEWILCTCVGVRGCIQLQGDIVQSREFCMWSRYCTWHCVAHATLLKPQRYAHSQHLSSLCMLKTLPNQYSGLCVVLWFCAVIPIRGWPVTPVMSLVHAFSPSSHLLLFSNRSMSHSAARLEPWLSRRWVCVEMGLSSWW